MNVVVWVLTFIHLDRAKVPYRHSVECQVNSFSEKSWDNKDHTLLLVILRKVAFKNPYRTLILLLLDHSNNKGSSSMEELAICSLTKMFVVDDNMVLLALSYYIRRFSVP